MAEFIVTGPYPVPIKKQNSGACQIDKDGLKDLSKSDPRFAKKGCYVFATRAPMGATPFYVGRTQRASLFKEAFNPRNQPMLNGYLNDRKKHIKLEIYLITQRVNRGPPPTSSIAEMEEILIANAATRNKELLNTHGVKKPKWSIRGVYNTGPGQPDRSAADFKKVIGL